MKKYYVTIERRIDVDIKEEKITEESIKTFSEIMWPIDGVEDIYKHLAYLAATEDRDIGRKNELIEGIGDTKEFGIKVVISHENITVDREDL